MKQKKPRQSVQRNPPCEPRGPCTCFPESCITRYSSRLKNNCVAVMRSGSEEGSSLRLVDFCTTQLLSVSNKEEEDEKMARRSIQRNPACEPSGSCTCVLV